MHRPIGSEKKQPNCALKTISLFIFGEMSRFTQVAGLEFEYDFTCTRKGVHLCFIISSRKMMCPFCSFRAVAVTVSFKLVSFFR